MAGYRSTLATDIQSDLSFVNVESIMASEGKRSRNLFRCTVKSMIQHSTLVTLWNIDCLIATWLDAGYVEVMCGRIGGRFASQGATVARL